MFKWIFFSLLIILSLGCENYCSGHGKCGTKDVCSCFMGWGGNDCSLRICPYGEAFADLPLGNLNHEGGTGSPINVKYATEWTSYGINPDLSGYVTKNRFHRYAECSNSGICNRKTGECACQGGFEGSACERRSCPTASNSKLPCNDHGKCISNYEKYKDYNGNGGGSYNGWELEKFYSCICDEGFSGSDCSLRTCPLGYSNIDSETTLTYEADNNSPTSGDLNNVLKSEFYFEVEYKNGNTFKTQSINNGECSDNPPNTPYYDTIAAENINQALKVIPGMSIETVLVKCDTPSKYSKIKIEFRSIDPNIKTMTVKDNSDPANHVELELKKDGSTVNGSSLKSEECGGKGICNTETGECECLTGYYGVACERDRTSFSL